jgi:hypothetical protein
MSIPCSGPGMTSPSEVRRNRVKSDVCEVKKQSELKKVLKEAQSRSDLYYWRSSLFKAVKLGRGGGGVLSNSHPVTLLDKWVLRPIGIDSLRGPHIIIDCAGGGGGDRL